MTHDELVQAALAARGGAYAPFSKYEVGAAALMSDGTLHVGANVENSSYGLTVCAERIALFKAVTTGSRELATLAVATRDGASMCGACRQVAVEFCERPEEITVLLANAEGTYRTTTLAELLPGSFRLSHD